MIGEKEREGGERERILSCENIENRKKKKKKKERENQSEFDSRNNLVKTKC